VSVTATRPRFLPGSASAGLECRRHQIVRLPGRTPDAEHQVVIGQVVAVQIDDAVLTADCKVDVVKIRPIARLGYQDYAAVEAVFQMAKRMPEDRVRAATTPSGG
jgi:flavin reductase (DIM6/NTAB) family NADH-FMN oxidoreductase RutF